MPLRNTYEEISQQELVPDRVEVHFQVTLSPRVSITELYFHLHGSGFRRTRSGRILSGDLGRFSGGQSLPVRITRPQPAAPLSVHVDVNPLRVMHERRSDYAPECALDRSTNWLHCDEAPPTNAAICNLVNELIDGARDTVERSFQLLAPSLNTPLPASVENISVSGIEATVDIAASDPISMIPRFREAFARQLRNTTEQAYADQARIYEGRDRDLPFVYGFRAAGERVKAYAKTTHRVRFEIALTRDALHAADIPLSLSRHGNDFGTFFGAVVQHVLPTLNALLTDIRRLRPPGGQGSITEFIALLAGSVRADNTETLRQILDFLIHNGSVSTSIERQLISRIEARGVFERSLVRGRSAIAARFYRAFEAMKHAFFGLTRRSGT